MYVVIRISDRVVTKICSCPNYTKAIDKAVELCREQCDDDEEYIRKILEKDNDFWWGDEDGWTVYVLEIP
jgi:hypothetical protein